MNLLELYSSLLLTAGLQVSKSGTVSLINTDGESQPALVGGKRLVVPTKQQLTSDDWKARVSFHPLAENILKGETEVASYYRQALINRLNLVFYAHCLNLLRIAASPAEHKKLKLSQTAYLTGVIDADEKTLESFKKVATRIFNEDNSDNLFVYETVKRNGKVAGKSYPRVGIVLFPFYDLLQKAENNTVMGVKLRVKDMNVYRFLCEYIMPDLDKPSEVFYTGSDSRVAPHFTALMNSAYKVIDRLNTITETFHEVDSDDYNYLYIRTDWAEHMQDLSDLVPQIRLIPNQDNSTVPVEEPVETTVAPSAPMANYNQSVPHMEMPTAPPVSPATTPAPILQPAPAPVATQAVMLPNGQIVQMPVQPSPVQVAVQPAPANNSVDAFLGRYYNQAPQPAPVMYAQPAPAPAVAPGWAGVLMNPAFNTAPAVASPYPIGEYGYPVKG